MSIFDPEQGAVYGADGQKIEGAAASQTAQPAAQEPSTTTASAPVTAPVVTEQNTSTTTQDINWESVLAEKTGGKFKSWDEIIPKINQEPVASQELSFKDEESRKVFDYLREGKIDDVLQVYNEQRRLGSLDKMSDQEALKLALEYKNPNFSPEDIEEEIASRYQAEKPDAPVEDDYLDEDAYKLAKRQYDKDLAKYEKEQKRLERQLKLDGQAAREQLASYKKDIILPDINPVHAQIQDNSADDAAIQENWKKARAEYLDSLNKTSADFKEIPFELSDEGVTFKGSFQVEDGERTALAKDLAEKDVVNEILLPRYDKGGVYDTKQLMEDIYFLNNKEKIIKALIRQAISQTSLEHLKQLKNIDLNQAQRGVVQDVSAETQRKQIADFAFGD